MKKIFNLFLLATALCIASCTSVNQTAPVMGIAGNNIATSVKADLDYQSVQKLQGEATTHRVLWIFKHTPGGNNTIKASNRYRGLNNTERVALNRAKNSADIDIILEPQFETYTKTYLFGIYKRTKVKATGWGVNIKGFSDNPTYQNSVERFAKDGLF